MREEICGRVDELLHIAVVVVVMEDVDFLDFL